MPAFPEFYEAVNGRTPFPWQARLAGQVAERERWPTEIGVPTGLGKTACLDIAVWWLASQAGRPPSWRTAPTRIWWLVDRRLAVDSTADHARRISEALRDGEAEPLRIVGERLRSLSAGPAESPLEVIRLRGGVGARRPADPSSPAVLLSTIPMYGSRLLFRGYGTSRSMRPVDAALAGCDSLLLLDEAHLARHLTNLVSALAACTDGAEEILGGKRSRPQVVALTATGGAGAKDRFDLDSDDRDHPVVRRRLDARKPLAIRIHNGDPGIGLADAAARLLEGAPHSSCLVFANTPETARTVLTRLRERFTPEAAETVLLTGRTREREAEPLRKRILDPDGGMAANRDPGIPRTRHLIAVATRTLEVGADIDAEYMVTEACGVRALTQRLGRLNRLGRFHRAQGVYLHTPPAKRGRGRRRGPAEWPVYGAEPRAVLERLEVASAGGGETVELPPGVVSDVLGGPGEDPGRAPEVLAGLLWEWTKTTTPPPGEAPVEPYFSGVEGLGYPVSVIWRVHVPEAGKRLWPRLSDREAAHVPLAEIRRTLGGDGRVARLRSDRITVASARTRDLRAGDVILLPTDAGLLDEHGWSPDATAPVFDISVAARGLPLDEEAIRRLGGVSLGEPADTAWGLLPLRTLLRRALGDLPDDEEIDGAERREAARLFHRALFANTPPGWEESGWRDFLAALEPRVVAAPDEVPRFRLATRKSGERASDELDEASLAPSAALLDWHGEAVGTMSGSIATRLGLPPDLADVIRLAGRWHDIGKADSRFQRWLDPGEEAASGLASPLLARSRMPRYRWYASRPAAGWPRGGRHEALSARLVRRWIETLEGGLTPRLADLLVHLVISHHGSGRPLVPPVPDGTPETVVSEIAGVRLEVSADLSVVDWEQPARFRRLNARFGPWGVALAETILRQADRATSGGPPTLAPGAEP